MIGYGGWKRLSDLRVKAGRAPTEKQAAAMNRNFKVFRLRGLYAYAGMLTGPRVDAMRRLVDYELIGLGAEPETSRRERLHLELMAKLEGEHGELRDVQEMDSSAT